jgi:flavin reductase (DIM6/NTAB) family NADH-FMN oxidoreductase RutF
VLERGQRELAGTLGRSLRRAPAKLEGVAWVEVPADPQRGPREGAADAAWVPAGALGWVGCALESETPAGDSTLMVGRVIAAGLAEAGEPLTMREAGFRHSG